METLNESGNKITHVVHIADIHVRNGNTTTARVDEYKAVFDAFIYDISKIDAVKEERAVLIIAGDVFHHKGRIDSVGGKVFFNWINSLLDILPILVICGNHDFRQEDPTFTDAIEMFVAPYTSVDTKHSISYLSKTGLYKWNNLLFGVTSVKDTLRHTSTHGVINDLPDFPDPCSIPNGGDIDCKIALFHGTISQSQLPSNRQADSVTKGYPLEWFNGYDIVMLGDNHKQQIHTYNNMSWGYPGSLVQQDFGEPTFGHGYILWNIEDKSGSMHHINNMYGAITLYKNNKVNLGAGLTCDITDALKQSRFPKHPKVRLVGTQLADYKITFDEHNIHPSIVKEHTSGHAETEHVPNTTISKISDFNNPEQWDTYIKSMNPICDVSKYLYQPNDFLIHNIHELPENIKTSIKNRTVKIQTCIDAYEKELHTPSRMYKAVALQYMQWEYLMCFAKNNYFNFSDCDGHVALLNGRNATGKSSFLDVLFIAIFGSPTTTRREYTGDTMSAKIIHDNKPEGESSYVILRLSVDNAEFEIYRTFTHASDSKRQDNVQAKIQIIYEIRSDGLKYPIAEGSTMVNRWIKDNIGTEDEIQMSTILCQHDTTNFFCLKTSEQRLVLERALHMETITAYEQLLDESLKAHKYIINEVSNYHTGIVVGLKDKPSTGDDIQTLQSELHYHESEVNKSMELYERAIATLGTDYDYIDDNSCMNIDSEDIKCINNELQDIKHLLAEKEQISFEHGKNEGIKEDLEQTAKELNISLDDLQEYDKTYTVLPVQPSMTRHALQERKTKLSTAFVIDFSNYKEDIQTARTLLSQLERIKDIHGCIMSYTTYEASHMYNIDDIQAMSDELSILKDDIVAIEKNKPIVYLSSYEELEKENDIMDLAKLKQKSETVNYQIKELSSICDTLSTNQYTSYCVSLNDSSNMTKHQSTGEEILNEMRELENNRDMITSLQSSLRTISRPVNDDACLSAWNAKKSKWDTLIKLLLSYDNPLADKSVVDLQSKLARRMKNLTGYETLSNAYREILLKIDKISSEITEIERIEFNPACKACCKQPKYVRLLDLKQELHNLTESRDELTRALTKYTDIKIQKWREESNFIQHILPLKEEHESHQADMFRESQMWTEAQEAFNSNKLVNTSLDKISVLYTQQYTFIHTACKHCIQTLMDEYDKFTKCIDNYEQYKRYIDTKKAYDVWENDYNRQLIVVKEKESLLTNILGCLYQRTSTLLEHLILFQEDSMLQKWEKYEKHLRIVELREQWIDNKKQWEESYTKYENLRKAQRLWNILCKNNKILAIKDKQRLQHQIQASMMVIKQLRDRIAIYENAQTISTKHHLLTNSIATYLHELNIKYNEIKELQTLFVGHKNDGFKTYVYNELVLPLIESEVNNFISCVDSFRLAICIKGSKFIFMVNDRGSKPTLDHASGYQKFIIGLGMRIALARIGAVGQNVKHLVLDEGFVACDMDNLLKISDMLSDIMLYGGYKSMILMSHLDVIRDAIQKRININRAPDDRSSNICYGEKRDPIPKGSIVTPGLAAKRRGRPSKH